MNSSFGIPRALLLLGLAGTVAAVAQSDAQALRVGLIPERNIFDQVARYEGLAEYLTDALGPEFELTMLSRYGNIVDRMQRAELQAAFLGSFTGALAAAQLGMEPVARPVNHDGTSTYFGVIFVRADSGIQTVADMRGKRLALVERATTGGYLFPMAYLQENGVDEPEAYFSEVRFWGSHDASLSAVLDGKADVGAAKNTVLEWQRDHDPRIERELRVLARSPRVPSNSLFISGFVDPRLTAKIRSALLKLHQTSRGREVLNRLGASKFELTRVADYAQVFELAAKAGIEIENYSYSNQ